MHTLLNVQELTLYHNKPPQQITRFLAPNMWALLLERYRPEATGREAMEWDSTRALLRGAPIKAAIRVPTKGNPTTESYRTLKGNPIIGPYGTLKLTRRAL